MAHVLTSTQNLTVVTAPPPYALLEPKNSPARIGDTYQRILVPSEYEWLYDQVARGGIVAIDLETHGLDPMGINIPAGETPEIAGMGLAGDGFSAYCHRYDDPDEFDYLLFQLSKLKNVQWIGHNIYFDGLWLRDKLGYHPNWHVCTYALFRHLATEGWLGQQWGLKQVMTDLLLWESANTDELDNWLITNGHVNTSKNPKKGEMWRAPAGILGRYCVLDVEATYLFYTRILNPVYQDFPALQDYERKFTKLITILIDQKLTGIDIDIPALHDAYSQITGRLNELHHLMRTDASVVEHINGWEAAALAEFMKTEPPMYNKKPERKEPDRLRKDGQVSKNWLRWKELESRPVEISIRWTNWKERHDAILRGENDEYLFNFRSGDHLRWLFYEQLKYPIKKTTDTGIPTTDVDTLSKFGAVGKMLEEFLLLEKELSFVTKYLELTEDKNKTTLHAGFKTPGTLTGRLSGSEPNLQAVPKSERFLRALRAREGHVWIDADFTALEPVVSTELSGDPTLMQVYGPNAEKGADIYLHTGAGIPALARRIRGEGYIPGQLTPDVVAHVKKACKHERSICKVVYLSSSYGAGPRKIHATLNESGVQISIEEVEQIHRQYWELYSGIKTYERKLNDEWRVRGGWVFNGIGRPIGVHPDYRKDLVNRVIQSTGHDILVMYVDILSTLLTERGIDWTPIIIDFHDQSIVEVPKHQAELTKKAFQDAVDLLNKQIAGTIPLRIVPQVVNNLAEAKLEG